MFGTEDELQSEISQLKVKIIRLERDRRSLESRTNERLSVNIADAKRFWLIGKHSVLCPKCSSSQQIDLSKQTLYTAHDEHSINFECDICFDCFSIPFNIKNIYAEVKFRDDEIYSD